MSLVPFPCTISNTSAAMETLPFPLKLFHILSNTWVSLPLRHSNAEDQQRLKASEIGLNLTICLVSSTMMTQLVGFVIPDVRVRWMYYCFFFICHPLSAIILAFIIIIDILWCHILPWRRKFKQAFKKERSKKNGHFKSE